MVDSYHYVNNNGKLEKQEAHLHEIKNGKIVEKYEKSIKNNSVKEKRTLSKDGGKTFKTILQKSSGKSTLSGSKKKMIKSKAKKK